MNQEDTNNAKEILSTIREIAKDYADGQIPFPDFYTQLNGLLGRLDPIDDMRVAFSPGQQHELEFYLKYSGGEFGESECSVPRKKNWCYGDSQKPYSWIDEEKFYEMFLHEYKRLNA